MAVGVTHVQEGVSSNPSTRYWMDIFHISCKNSNVCLKRPKIDEKEAGDGPIFILDYLENSLYGRSQCHQQILVE